MEKIKKFFKSGFCFFRIHWKQIWAFILFAAGISYIKVNYNNIETAPNLINIIIVLFTVTIAVLPIVTEINVFGFSLKKELYQTKTDLENKILDLKMQIVNANSNANSNYNLLYSPVSSVQNLEELLMKLTSSQQEANSSDKAEQGMVAEDEVRYPDYPVEDGSDLNTILFKARRDIEIGIRKALNKLDLPYELGLIRNLINLKERQYIDSSQYDLFKNVIQLCNRGIHGENVDEQYIIFVKNATPKLLNILKNINFQDKIVCCRCGYRGDQSFGNRCPECGNYLDD